MTLKDRQYRILAFDCKNIVFRLLLESFQRMGHTVRIIDLQGDVSWDSIRSIFSEFKPDFCIGQNYYSFDPDRPMGRILEEYLEATQIPCVNWFVDNPKVSSLATLLRFENSPPPTRMLFLCQDRTHLDFWRRLNLPTQYFAPAADASHEGCKFFDPNFAGGITYVGYPGTVATKAYSAHTLKELYVLGTISEFSGPSTQGFGQRALESQAIQRKVTDIFLTYYSTFYSSHADFDKACDTAIAELATAISCSPDLLEFYFRMRMGVLYSFFQMARYVQELQVLGIRTFGSPIWANIIDPKLVNEKYLELSDLNAVYASSKILFVYTKWHVPTGYSERPIHVLAAGGFPLNDYREELANEFEKDELVLYRSLEEAGDLAQYYLEHESERNKIIEKGRAKVFKRHTYRHRAEELIGHVHRVFDI